MAVISKITIGTGDKVSMDYQSSDCSVVVSWELERNDTDLRKFIAEHAKEMEEAHYLLRERIIEYRLERQKNPKEPNGQFPPKNGQGNTSAYKDSKNGNGKTEMATEKQIKTALSLQKQLGVSVMDVSDLSNLTKKEVSSYISSLFKKKDKALEKAGAR